MANATRQVHHDKGRSDAIRLVVLLILSLSALGTSGCSLYLEAHPPQFPDTSLIQEGRSSGAEVVSALGQPNTTYRSNGKTVDVFKFHYLAKADPDQQTVADRFAGEVFTLGLIEVVATPVELVRQHMLRSTTDYVVTYGQDGKVESVRFLPE